ncbi:UDP-N-acetylmuramoyl-L-alanyl-D-glutamate--2,6-diaminopimelate ligase [Paralimibaculum aggregatum]|uniref:UDP-N-acetylmuramoyl-L-alanyl-D-glutamate--2,6-diaminopimelate ligase n=1 Tax=Paralimibaculum aggregatum TaxID=3036245 RepID=A0ABQ6LG88_9RHOB|nr:UDP-N-acetylmuramoyl-L-alanyl-D-glutamate--2,6-diaminopimelate ligase [Limibaculum sp. NKW23]GMG82339.1 UDP-N-acetylmuramoyl-L-alanyl-D-glutamate--2,6-diaminopimelate ligase [Limibaculum sp. NKW23]
MSRALTLAGLGLAGLPRRGPEAEPRISGLAIDSRAVREGDLFFALPGTVVDGARFAQYAVRQGAAAVVATPTGAEILRADLGGLPVPVVITDSPRAALAHAAAAFWPRQPEVMVAVTGTNGKTSVAAFLRQIWAHAGHRAAAFGTTGVEGAGRELAGAIAHTTPEPLTLHRLLDRLAEAGITHAAMEASSHGLVQHRTDGVRLAAGALTNIQRDHMDYHPTHEDYVAAKLRLFAEVLPEGAAAVVAAAEPHGREVRALAEARGLLFVGVGEGGALSVSERSFHGEGQRLTLGWMGERVPVSLDLVGPFQGDNAALAAGLALATGTPPEAVFAALPRLTGVRGRMERVARRANGAQIFVDYAHTPDALATALAALRPHCAGRLIVVAGAGGDRDRGKRPLMGRAMDVGADHAIVTDDNPRSEDPAAIRAEVMAGCPEGEEIGDRTEAILAGVDALKGAGDCLLIAGKGHEQGQEIGGQLLPFDDASQARAAVAALDGGLGEDGWDLDEETEGGP